VGKEGGRGATGEEGQRGKRGTVSEGRTSILAISSPPQLTTDRWITAITTTASKHSAAIIFMIFVDDF